MTNPAPTDSAVPTPNSLSEGRGIEQEIRLEILEVADRVERLLLRQGELQRTNELLAEQVRVLTQDRDSLRSRLSAARARVEALIERLPDNASHPSPSSTTQPGTL
jgi:chromosome segregation ATPase